MSQQRRRTPTTAREKQQPQPPKTSVMSHLDPTVCTPRSRTLGTLPFERLALLAAGQPLPPLPGASKAGSAAKPVNLSISMLSDGPKRVALNIVRNAGGGRKACRRRRHWPGPGSWRSGPRRLVEGSRGEKSRQAEKRRRGAAEDNDGMEEWEEVQDEGDRSRREQGGGRECNEGNFLIKRTRRRTGKTVHACTLSDSCTSRDRNNMQRGHYRRSRQYTTD